MGLSVSKQIAESMGGTIEQIDMNPGCQFKLTLNLF
jgi:C4-dicarboxylate-specific signal transduction histidine kinase